MRHMFCEIAQRTHRDADPCIGAARTSAKESEGNDTTERNACLDHSFWTAKKSSTGNQTGTLLHEMSHLVDVGSTKDVTTASRIASS